ncbi:hypothetical protein AKJ16_DCAP13528 [Drosera capensis]
MMRRSLAADSDNNLASAASSSTVELSSATMPFIYSKMREWKQHGNNRSKGTKSSTRRDTKRVHDNVCRGALDHSPDVNYNQLPKRDPLRHQRYRLRESNPKRSNSNQHSSHIRGELYLSYEPQAQYGRPHHETSPNDRMPRLSNRVP